MKHGFVVAICHFAFLAGIGLYTATFHPVCRMLALLLILAGAAIEYYPRIFQSMLVPEHLLAPVIAVAWWQWPKSATSGDAYRAVGLVFAYLLLIPSRRALGSRETLGRNAGAMPAPGRIKWLLGLAVLELASGIRGPGADLAAICVMTIGLLALAIDSWLAGFISGGRQSRATPNTAASFIPWALLPALIVLAGANLMGTWLVEETASYHAIHRSVRADEFEETPALTSILDDMSIGDHPSIERDPQIIARLFWENGSPPREMVYLRALAVPDLVLSGAALTWTARPLGERRIVHEPFDPNQWVWLERVASPSEVVLRPDGANRVELPDVSSDDIGNLYSPALKDRVVKYRVGLNDQPLKADPALLQRCLEVDPRLDELPWHEVEEPDWALLSPEKAAGLVCARLQNLCSYECKNLPLPVDGPAGALRGFLFGPTAEARRGHCQYFATAAALLLRRAGHPVRCVTGFASDEIDPRGIIFRALHFHAWIEVINSQGEWQQFDPTPKLRMQQILAGVSIPAPSAHSTRDAVPTDQPATSTSLPERRTRQAILALSATLLGLAIVAAFRRRKVFSRSPSKPHDPRLIELQRRNDDLIKVATTLGIAVTPATTLSDLVAALERRTSISLEEHRRAHLAARFGRGPLPAPWPLSAITKAAEVRVRSND